MNGTARLAMLLVSLILSLLFLAGSVGIPGSSRSERPSRKGDGADRFHGQPAVQSDFDPSCQSGKCHPPAPHERGGAIAAFLNFHGEFADCMVCHGKSRDDVRVERKESPGRHVLRSAKRNLPPNPHELLATPTTCRECHSESGKSVLRSRGLREFPNGFENPMVLRMIEERRNRWLPAGLQ